MNSPKTLVLLASFAILLSACTLGELSEDQIRATAQILASTEIVQTLAALPSDTPLPTYTSTSIPTNTAEPSLTPSQTSTETPSPYPTAAATWTPFGVLQPTDMGSAQANKSDKNAALLFDNQSGEQIQFTFTSPIYQEYDFTKNMIIIVDEDTYTYQAFIGNKGPYTGTISVTNGDKHVLTFYKDHIHFATP